jgi:hypothetical protein
MPPMGQPYRGWPGTASPTSGRAGARGSRGRPLRIRLGTAVHRQKLTRALAEGADPMASGELALLARQLTSERKRRRLVRSLRGVLAEAHQPPLTRARLSIIDRRAVIHAEAAIIAMIKRLGSPKPVQPQGVALLIRILTNADGRSPLYASGEPVTLCHVIRSATAALDTQSARSHEFALAV